MSRWSWKAILAFTFLLMLLAGCGGGGAKQTPTTPTQSPISNQGQQLLTKAAQRLKSAKTVHAIIDITTAGPAVNGTMSSDVWNESPNKSRTVVLQSTLKQFPIGLVTVSNGKQVWQYDPAKKVVYSGQPSDNADSSSSGTGQNGNRSIMSFMQSVFTNSNATLVSSSARIKDLTAYEIHVTSKASGQSGSTRSGNFNYDGEVYLDKTSMLPLQVKLMIQGLGQETLDLPTLTLNQAVDDHLFTFTPPPGVQVLPFPKTTTSNTGTITLEQAQRQAGYHLLSVRPAESGYQLQGVDALGAPGNQIYTLNYIKGNTAFAISEGRSLANLPISGQKISLRGTTGTVSATGNTMTLTWTEQGIGVQIAGNVSKDELVTIANLLS
jgi:outer membrane lipoprotein-sorting protein